MIESGLISAFRLLVFYWLARLIFRYFLDQARGVPTWLTPWQLFLLVFLASLILLLLSKPAFQRRFGQLFLPTTLALAIGMLGLEKYWQLTVWTVPTTDLGNLLYAFSLQAEFILPLLLIAWQYTFGAVALYTAAITTLQWGLMDWFVTPANARWTLLPEDYIEYALMYLLVGYVVTWLMVRQRQQRAKLAAANARLVTHAATIELLAVTQERNRLARELHDLLAHSLTSITVQLGAIGRLWETDRDKAKLLLAQVDQTARTGVQESRRALQSLRSAPLEELGLAEALHELAQSITQRANIALHWNVTSPLDTLPAATEQALYRIAQEALENIARHAEAQQVIATLDLHAHSITLQVQDDGVGFDPTHEAGKNMTGKDTQYTHWGLRGIRERAELLGGTVEIQSKVGEGTRLLVRLPIPMMGESMVGELMGREAQ